MSQRLCPAQDVCCHYKTGSNRPNNHDVRNKYVCQRYVKMCEHAVYYETEIMGLTIACEIKKGKK